MDVEAQLVAALAEQRRKGGGCQTIIGIALEEVRRLETDNEGLRAEVSRMSAGVRFWMIRSDFFEEEVKRISREAGGAAAKEG